MWAKRIYDENTYQYGYCTSNFGWLLKAEGLHAELYAISLNISAASFA
jgi:hypothetical protein